MCVTASPSIAEQQRVAKEELERIEKQRSDLGEEGLANKGKELKDAMEVNEVSCVQSEIFSVLHLKNY